jgi:hypothetical protein
MKVGNLWRSRYDDAMKENKILKNENRYLKGQLITTIGVVVIMFIYYIIKIKS